MTQHDESIAFLDRLNTWKSNLQTLSLPEIIQLSGGPDRVTLFCVDMINGFCHEGPLSSPRVKGIVQSVIDLLTLSHALGIRQFVLTQDAHQDGSPEFDAYPAHCVRGTREAETIPEIASLPFAKLFKVIPKRSLSSSIETDLEDHLSSHLIETAIVIGNCTDLCVYQLAMHLRMRANATGKMVRVIVPAECVQTYDLQPDTARKINALPHPGDLMQVIFLYHMQLNGVEIVEAVHG